MESNNPKVIENSEGKYHCLISLEHVSLLSQAWQLRSFGRNRGVLATLISCSIDLQLGNSLGFLSPLSL